MRLIWIGAALALALSGCDNQGDGQPMSPEQAQAAAAILGIGAYRPPQQEQAPIYVAQPPPMYVPQTITTNCMQSGNLTNCQSY